MCHTCVSLSHLIKSVSKSISEAAVLCWGQKRTVGFVDREQLKMKYN